MPMPLTAYLDLYLADGLTKAEEQEMFALILKHDNTETLESYIYEKLRESENVPGDTTKLRELSFKNISARIDAQNKPVRRLHLIRSAWFKYAAAIILIVGTATFLLTKEPATRPATENITKSTILPGSEKAILTLSDGRRIELNNATSETISDGTLSIKNDSGQLVYEGLPIPNGGAGVAFNTMSTPAGGKYQLVLSDGTKVWLNAASSITYPIAFRTSTREVSITGEVYFEVAANKSKPFIVKTISEEIKVLGTSFNINSYNNEPHPKTSLIAGSVKVANKILQPGQAFINGKIIKTNIAQDIAWINGVFNFESMSFQQAMRQISRWYDIEIEYEKEIPNIELEGKMGMDLNLTQVLESLKDVNVRFRLSGRKLIIQP